VHLELFDLDEAIQLGIEGDEVAQKLFPWPEPRGHSLLKVGRGHFERGDHGLADEYLRRAWALLEGDTWFRWRWHIPLLHARGELALAEGDPDAAWTFAARSLEMAEQSDSRKHVVRAQRLQGRILTTRGHLDDAVEMLKASAALAEAIGTPRDIWLGKIALGEALDRRGRDAPAAASYAEAAQTIEAIAAKLSTVSLRRSLLSAEPVLAVFRKLGRRPPAITPSD